MSSETGDRPISPYLHPNDQSSCYRDMMIDHDARMYQGFSTVPNTPATDITTPPLTPPGARVLSGCTWHTIDPAHHGYWPHAPDFRPLNIAQHLPPMLSPLQQQVHQILAAQGGVVEPPAVFQVTDVLMNTVAGIDMLKRTLGEHVVGNLLAVVLKGHNPHSHHAWNSDPRTCEPIRADGMRHRQEPTLINLQESLQTETTTSILSRGISDPNWLPQGSPNNANDLLPIGLLE